MTDDKHLCEKAVREYFIKTDDGRYDALIEHFTDDAEFIFFGQTFTGRAQIDPFLQRDRGPDDKYFHHVTGFSVSEDSAGGLTARTHLLVHVDRWETNTAGEKVHERGILSAVYDDEFVIEGGRAKTKRRIMTPKVMTLV